MTRKSPTKFFLVLLLGAFAALGGCNCGDNPVNADAGVDDPSCTVTDNGDGSYTETCPDGSSVTWQDGTDGVDGNDGNDGNNGTDGTDGNNGQDGEDAEPCTVTDNGDGTITFDCPGSDPVVIGEPNQTDATLEINTAGVDGEVFLNGNSLGTSVSGSYLAVEIIVTYEHVISFGDIDGFNTPSDIVIPANTLGANTTHTYTGVYLTPEPHTGYVIGYYPGGVVPGPSSVDAVTYRIYNTGPSNPLTSLQVVNDLDGAFDSPTDTVAVAMVRIVCEAGSDQNTYTASMVGGQATVNGMNCYDGDDEGDEAEVLLQIDIGSVTTSTLVLSGMHVRVGIHQDSIPMVGQDTLPDYIVRKAVPLFGSVTQATTQLGTTNVELYKFKVTGFGGNVVLGRLVFDVTTAGLETNSTDDIYNFRFERNGVVVSNVNIFAVGSVGCDANATINVKDSASGGGLQDACADNLGVDDATYKVIVSFDVAEEVTANSTNTYTLYASVTGATTDDGITTSLAVGDEQVELSGLLDTDSNGNGNSGRLSAGATDNIALFGDADTQCGTPDDFDGAFAYSVGLGICNVVWSDKSGGAFVGAPAVHTYPAISGGFVTEGSGTVDWTNGYMLGVDQLLAYSYTK